MNLANLLVPPPSLNGTTHVIVLPEKFTSALATDTNENNDIIISIKILRIFSPLENVDFEL